MSQDDVTQIKVGGQPTGIIGLKNVLSDMAEEYGDRPDQDIMKELLNRLGKKNSKEIGAYGVMGTPALIMNGKVKSVGKVPAKKQLKDWLIEAKRSLHQK